MPELNPALTSVGPSEAGPVRNATVPVVTVDAAAAGHLGDAAVRMLIVNTPGSELAVLEGARRTLRRAMQVLVHLYPPVDYAVLQTVAEVIRHDGATGINIGVLGEDSGDLVLDSPIPSEDQHVWVQGLAPGWDRPPPERERAAHPAAYVFDPLATARPHGEE